METSSKARRQAFRDNSPSIIEKTWALLAKATASDAPTHDNSSLVYEAVIACQELFSDYAKIAEPIHKRSHEHSFSTDRASPEVQMSVRERLSLVIENEEPKFNAWCSYTGAGIADFEQSLDGDLREQRGFKEKVLRALGMLKDSLKGGLSDRDEGLQEELVTERTQSAIRKLQSMKERIREVRTLGQNHPTTWPMGLSWYFQEHFERDVALLIKLRHPHAPRSLRQQLAASIALRRKRLAVLGQSRLSESQQSITGYSYEDAKPYVCLAEECTHPLRFFSSFDAWESHMITDYDDDFPRWIHATRMWRCTDGHEVEKFYKRKSYVKHLKDQSKHPDQHQWSDDLTEFLATSLTIRVPHEHLLCPLCGCVPGATEKYMEICGPEGALTELKWHVSDHLIELAKLSIPVLAAPAPLEYEPSTSADGDGDGRLLKSDEEASCPSGYDEELHALPLPDDEHRQELPPLDVSETRDTYWHDVGFVEWRDEEPAVPRESGHVADSAAANAELMLPSLNRNDYTIGWLCTLPVEFAAATASLEERHEGPTSVAKHDRNIYSLGTVGRHNVVVARPRGRPYGTSYAAVAAKNMLLSFPSVCFKLLVGVGSGAPGPGRDVRLGDIVVSHRGVLRLDSSGMNVVQHSGSARVFNDLPPGVLRTAVERLQALSKFGFYRHEDTINQILEKYPQLQNEYSRPGPERDELYRPNVINIARRNPSRDERSSSESWKPVPKPGRTKGKDGAVVHHGLMITASHQVRDAWVRGKIAEETGALCFDTRAADLGNFPCLFVRGICTYKNSHRDRGWHAYAALAAAGYAKDVLRQIAPELLRKGFGEGAKIAPKGSRHNEISLLQAVMLGDEHRVGVLLDQGGVELNVRGNGPWGRTLLFEAVDGGHEVVVKLLLDSGADVDTADKYGQTPLLLALGRGTKAVAKPRRAVNKHHQKAHVTMIKYQPSQESTPWAVQDRTPSPRALLDVDKGINDDLRVLRLLVSSGADVNMADKSGQTPLLAAITNRSMAAINLLLDSGADVNKADASGRTPLIAAIDRRSGSRYRKPAEQEAIVRQLLRQGASVDMTNNAGHTPLLMAVKHRLDAIVELLLQSNANVHTEDKAENTPFSLVGDIVTQSMLRASGPAPRERGNNQKAMLRRRAPVDNFRAIMR